jgi:uncharacterized membrane protein
MTHENVVSIQLEDPARADEVLGLLRDASEGGKLGLHAAIVVRVEPDGSVHVGDLEETPGPGMQRGGALGGLLGVLGGPIGMVVGWGVGARLGETADAAEAEREEDALVAAVRRLPAGSVAVVAEVEEQPDNEHRLDELMADAGGIVHRRPVDVLLDELEAHVAAGDVPEAVPDAPRTERGERIDALKARIEGRAL